MPPNTVYVGRGTRWGNPWRVTRTFTANLAVSAYRAALARGGYRQDPDALWVALPAPDTIRAELRGKNLACWCPPDQPCHANILLTIANQENP